MIPLSEEGDAEGARERSRKDRKGRTWWHGWEESGRGQVGEGPEEGYGERSVVAEIEEPGEAPL